MKLMTAALSVVAAALTTAPAIAQVAHDGQYAAEVRRTEYGIPHILAGDVGSLGYGYGYAFAQDNLCDMADRVLTLRGERSKYLGPTADSGDALSLPTTNLDSDIYYTGVRQSGVVQQLMAQPAPVGPTAQARQLVDGYVAGYNHYLRDTGVANLPDPTCRGAAWVTPITALDVWSNIDDIDQLQGTKAFKHAIATATPPAGNATSASVLPLGDLGDIGSNGWALGRDATVGHDGMLLVNPHLPWAGDARVYQVQLTIPGVLDVSGGSLYGTPTVEIGHTSGLAWTHTTSHAQHASVYQLALTPGDPRTYLVDGHPEPMTTQTVTVTVRGPDGTLSTVSHTAYRSRFGPVLSGWTPTTAYAVNDPNTDNIRALNEWLAMDESQTLAQLRAAQDAYQGLPWAYTLATDTGGTTYFVDSSLVPHLTDDQGARCIKQAGGQRADVLDGSTSACAWGSDPDAVTPGVFGPSHYPTLTRADFVANANQAPWLTNPAAPLSGYPAVYGAAGTPLELRPRLGFDMISSRLGGTDGFGPPGFTLDTLQETVLDDRNYSAETGRADVLAMCRAHPELTASDGRQVDVRDACDVLSAWDGHGDLDSRGAVLWRHAFGQLNTSDWYRVPFDPAHPLTTPNGINSDNLAVQHAFADAVQYFQANTIPLDLTLHTAQRYASVPVPGCTEGEGCFNIVGRSGSLGSGGTYPDMAAGSGSSFVMAVEITPRGPRARTILTYSESANPDSPHHADQTALFAAKQWVTERFTQAEIASDPQLHITSLHGC